LPSFNTQVLTHLLSVVLQLGTLYQQPFKTYLRHHPVFADISKLNYLAGHMALMCRSMFIKTFLLV